MILSEIELNNINKSTMIYEHLKKKGFTKLEALLIGVQAACRDTPAVMQEIAKAETMELLHKQYVTSEINEKIK